jgi:hypothetical protein
MVCIYPSEGAPQSPYETKFECEPTPDDYAVWWALIRALEAPEYLQGKELVVATATAKPSQLSEGGGSWGSSPNSKDAPAKDTMADFAVHARRFCTVEMHLGNPQSYRIISQGELDKIFAKGGGNWKEFYRRYPKAGGVWQFSRPGYNSARDETVLYVSHSCGGLCGTGNLYFLVKQNDHWVVKNRLELWIS